MGLHIGMQMGYLEDPAIQNVNNVGTWKKMIRCTHSDVIADAVNWMETRTIGWWWWWFWCHSTNKRAGCLTWVDKYFRTIKRTEDLVGSVGFPRIDQRILYRIWESKNGLNRHLQIVLPRSSVLQILHRNSIIMYNWISDGRLLD